MRTVILLILKPSFPYEVLAGIVEQMFTQSTNFSQFSTLLIPFQNLTTIAMNNQRLEGCLYATKNNTFAKAYFRVRIPFECVLRDGLCFI